MGKKLDEVKKEIVGILRGNIEGETLTDSKLHTWVAETVDTYVNLNLMEADLWDLAADEDVNHFQSELWKTGDGTLRSMATGVICEILSRTLYDAAPSFVTVRDELAAEDPETDESEILAEARAKLFHGQRDRDLRAHYEHGQWWVEDFETGAQWSVVDCETETGEAYFDFEQVSKGEEE